MASSLYLALTAIAVHTILFLSIFDIYFTSPIESGMAPQSCPLPPPAKRLVLFVADGLRADTLFSLDGDGRSTAPYLRNIVENKGKWGVSHTHVPTESRPGHVALIAGFYEDVSAVTRGWQDNPVPFDSVLNQSRHSWSWGSPDILPMFANGATPGKVDAFVYDADWEDFADSDASKLDTWVFDRVKELFNRARSDTSLAEKLSQDKIILFLHLLGIDTNGHAHRPTSREVSENLVLVDSGIKETVALIQSYFGDDKTAFVFTSDHGMTDWGSHGAGLPDETMTPLICWGAGVKMPIHTGYSSLTHHDSYSRRWGLEVFERVDVEQADIAPLMSTLIGTSLPINSEGVLPLDYIHYNKGFLANAIFTNSRQLLEQFRVKAQRIHSACLPMTFQPFPKVSLEGASEFKFKIHSYIKEKNYQMAIESSQELIALAKEGVRYYHTYHRFSLKFVVTLGFLGWIGYIVLAILDNTHLPSLSRNTNHRSFPIKTAVFTLLTFILLFLQVSPPLYYLYYAIPLLSWSYLWRNRDSLRGALSLAKQTQAKTFKVLAVSLSVLCGLEILVVSFFHREMLSILLLFLSGWPYFTKLLSSHLRLCLTWSFLCISLAVFPLLPVMGRTANYYYVTFSGVVAVSFVLVCMRKYQHFLFCPDSQSRHSKLLTFQAIILGVASFVPFLVNSYFVQKEAIPILIHVFSWCTLVFSIIAPLLGPKSLPGRLLHIALSLYTIFILLSTSFEALFLLLLCLMLYVWLSVEEAVADRHLKIVSFQESLLSLRTPEVVTLVPNDPRVMGKIVSAESIRQVAFCLLLGLLSFFGTGNIASVNTFDPSSVYCFLTVFSPFVMGGLILLKMVVPFVLVSCVYNTIMTILGHSLRNGLLLMMIMTNVMALNFFFLVRDSGSWLEIGVSISHYVIMMVVCIGIVILMGVARLLTGVTVLPRKLEDHIF